MTQRLNLAQALLHEPAFVILDEPFSNLDPIGRTELKKIILNLKNMGKTILFSSHILSDVEELADRVAIINDAAMLFQGSISELSKRAIKELSFLVGLYAPVEITKFQNLHNGILSVAELKPCFYKITFRPELLPQQQEIASALLNAMLLSGFKIKEFSAFGHTLDEMFVSILGEMP
jgi:ABC-type multidrug transport system ATPase subunit